MTLRAGSLQNGVVSAFANSKKWGRRSGGVQYLVGPPSGFYKNQGWYAATSTWETWISYEAPNAIPPSGHTLTGVQYIQVR